MCWKRAFLTLMALQVFFPRGKNASESTECSKPAFLMLCTFRRVKNWRFKDSVLSDVLKTRVFNTYGARSVFSPGKKCFWKYRVSKTSVFNALYFQIGFKPAFSTLLFRSIHLFQGEIPILNPERFFPRESGDPRESSVFSPGNGRVSIVKPDSSPGKHPPTNFQPTLTPKNPDKIP